MIRALATACLLALFCAGTAAAQDRHALVIGINAYDNLGALEKAVNDGRAMAESLEREGFTVDAGYDLTRRDFVQLLAQFLDRLQPDDEALVFYAGHAVAIGNSNFLVPADASALEQSSETVIIAESIGQDFLLEQITATGVRLTVVIMDACRNNPFGRGLGRTVGREAGLAIIPPPRGVFILYSADEGQVALDRLSDDDPDPNSIFTRTLLPLIEEPGLDIVDVARRLRGGVQALAASIRHPQFPVYRDRMQGDGQFILRPATDVVEQPGVSIPAAGSTAAPCVEARADWAELGETPSAFLLEAFIQTHLDCALHMAMATERLAALRDERHPSVLSAEAVEIDISPRSDGDTIVTPASEEPVTINEFASDRDVIRALQSELNRHNCEAGIEDGGFGPTTATSLMMYFFLEPNGMIPLDRLDVSSRPSLEAVLASSGPILEQLRTTAAPACGRTVPSGFSREVTQGCLYEQRGDVAPGEYAEWSGACDQRGFVTGEGRLMFIYPVPVPGRYIDYYEGDMCAGSRCGQGARHLVNGAHYSGGFDNDKPEGQGTLFNSDGEAIYRGQWCAGTRCGIGIEYFLNTGSGAVSQYEGEWDGQNMHGEGTYTYSSGRTLSGSFQEDFPIGRMRFTYTSGTIHYYCFSGSTWEFPASQCAPPITAPGAEN